LQLGMSALGQKRTSEPTVELGSSENQARLKQKSGPSQSKPQEPRL
jgi:hypothetical protein